MAYTEYIILQHKETKEYVASYSFRSLCLVADINQAKLFGVHLELKQFISRFHGAKESDYKKVVAKIEITALRDYE